jgi:trans-aconitate 2-methyltransferase
MVQVERWSPDQYNKFRDERMLPFFDLVELIRPEPGMRVIDLGCGTGEITASLAERLPDATVEGVDLSADMLAQAAPRANDRLSFRQMDVGAIDDCSAYDLVFSNAALQWVPDNESVLRRILGSLKPGAQIAVQVPKNEGHPSHRLAAEVAAEPPYREMLGGFIRESHALSLERYAELLYDNGLREQVCIEKIYGHVLGSTRDVVEWVKGTMLNAYLSRLQGEDRERFLAAYTERLLGEIGDRAPYFYPFRRLLFWGRKG